MTYLSLTGKDSLQRMDITEALPSPYTPIALKVQAPMVSRYCEALDLCKNPLAQRFFPSLRRLFQTTTEMACALFCYLVEHSQCIAAYDLLYFLVGISS